VESGKRKGSFASFKRGWRSVSLDEFVALAPTASPLVAIVALLVSIIALVRAARVAKRDGLRALDQALLEMREHLVSRDLRKARRAIGFAPPIIRAAGNDYAPWSPTRTYLRTANAAQALQSRGARDHDELVDAYAEIMLAVAQMGNTAPRRRTGYLARRWREASVALYGQLDEVLASTGESRWELNKFDSLWPLDRETMQSEKITLLSDEVVAQQLKYLNSRRDRVHAAELRLPHHPLPGR
jgi:hypothetical protein